MLSETVFRRHPTKDCYYCWIPEHFRLIEGIVPQHWPSNKVHNDHQTVPGMVQIEMLYACPCDAHSSQEVHVDAVSARNNFGIQPVIRNKSRGIISQLHSYMDYKFSLHAPK